MSSHGSLQSPIFWLFQLWAPLMSPPIKHIYSQQNALYWTECTVSYWAKRDLEKEAFSVVITRFESFWCGTGFSGSDLFLYHRSLQDKMLEHYMCIPMDNNFRFLFSSETVHFPRRKQAWRAPTFGAKEIIFKCSCDTPEVPAWNAVKALETISAVVHNVTTSIALMVGL